jgi:large subunit ribosomal protein L25
MIHKDLDAEVRTSHGKGAMRRLRSAGKTPGVVYSKGKDALSLTMDAAALYRELFAIHGRNAVINLRIAGDARELRHVLVQDIQKNPVTDQVIHVDFYEISLNEERAFKVPVTYVGTAKGVEFGGDLHIIHPYITLKGKPVDIPDTIEVDVTPLTQDHPGIKLGDYPLPEGVILLDDPNAIGVLVR